MLIVSRTCSARIGFTRTEFALQIPRRLQQERRLRLILPVRDHDLEQLRCNPLYCVHRALAVFSLDPEIGEHLPDRLDHLLIRREYEAAQGHTIPA